MGLSVGKQMCRGDHAAGDVLPMVVWEEINGQEWGSWNSISMDWRMGKQWSAGWRYVALAKLSGAPGKGKAEKDSGQTSAPVRSDVRVRGPDNRGSGRWRDKQRLLCPAANPQISQGTTTHESNEKRAFARGRIQLLEKSHLGANLKCCVCAETNNSECLTLISLKLLLKMHFLNGKCQFETEVSLKNNFKMKHCNISKYLFPFEGVEMRRVALAYSFALLFFIQPKSFSQCNLSSFSSLEVLLFGMNLPFTEIIPFQFYFRLK